MNARNPNVQHLSDQMPRTALAFRGYNVTNLGRSGELLAHPAYGFTVERYLQRASAAAADTLKRPVDLVALVRGGKETTLETYGDAVALILAMESAQLDLLRTHFGVDYTLAQFSLGYSLGEIAALVAGGVIGLEAALKIPLSLCDECVALTHDVTLGILFTRASELPLDDIRRICLAINSEGRGVIGISAHLSPNSVLLMGQQDTLDRFKTQAGEALPVKVQLRKNSDQWPPLHTPIVWERQIPNRAAYLLHTLPMNMVEPKPPVLSLVTGRLSYTDSSARSMLHQWVDHPQRLWEAMYEVLSQGIKTVLHVGPLPNLIPATFKRLSDNVHSQTDRSLAMRTLSAAVRRPWLQAVLPQRAALLRAPYVEHVILEDWLLANAPA